MDEVVNCIVCGKPLQIVFAGISEQFTGGLFIEKDGTGKWYVCTNPQCPDGSKNVSQGANEVEI